MSKLQKSWIGILLVLASIASLVLTWIAVWRFETTPDEQAQETFKHRFMKDRLSVTFKESVTASQAVRLTNQMGYEVIDSCFSDVILKAELQEGWSERMIDDLKAIPSVVEVKLLSWKKSSTKWRRMIRRPMVCAMSKVAARFGVSFTLTMVPP